MGVNDPNAPFNQVDIIDEYDMIIEECDWITDEMLENEYSELYEAIDIAVANNKPEKYMNRKEKHKFLTDNAKQIAKDFYDEYLIIKKR